jgi:HAE1 family hydrophobic/amphiphilic exporter-1
MPVLMLNLVGDIPNESLKLLAEELKTEILAVPDVREITLLGEYEREFHVSLDPEKLRRFGVTFGEAARAVESANMKLPTGRFQTGETEYVLDAGRRFSSQREVLDTVVRRDGDGNFIRVGDLVTTAMMGYRDPITISSANGLNTLSLLVKKEEAGNAISIADAVKVITARFEEANAGEGISILYTWDSTVEIDDSINTLGGNMVLGMGLIVLVLWLTLGFRNAMLTAIGIPFSFLTTIIIMKLTGMSINTISLFSFVLVSGIIVDDAVIILENVFRHMQMGKAAKEAIVDGVAEVMLPVLATALTTVLAFLPMLIMTGSTGDFFAVIPWTVTFALAASLFEALFILPVHIKEWGPKSLPRQATHVAEGFGRHLESGVFRVPWRIYRRLLDVLLANKLKTVGAMFAVFVVAVGILYLSVSGKVPLINVTFFPASFFRYHIGVEMPPGTSIEKTDEVVRDLSLFVVGLGKGQAQAASGAAGLFETEDYQFRYAHNLGQVVVTFPPEKERRFPDNPKNDIELYIDYIRDRVNGYLDTKYSATGFRPKIVVFPENTGPPSGKPVNVRVSGNNREQAESAAADIMQYLRIDEAFADLVDLGDDRPVYQKAAKYRPLEEAAYEYGLEPGAVTALLAGALNGKYSGAFRAEDEEVDLLVRLARSYDPANPRGQGISEPPDILDVPIVEHSSAPVFVRDIAELTYESEPAVRTRYNGKPAITVTSDIRQGSRLTASRAMVLVKNYFDGMSAEHPGVAVSFGGEFEATSRSYMSLMLAFIIALIAIYLVLATQFKDYIQPVIIISGIFFAVIGVVFGMFVTRSTFTVASFMAVVGLAGVAVNDSLILIDFINVRRREGMPMREAVLDACSARMRPVLITTVTTMLGLLPMAIGIPRKSMTWAPMATAFVTGLSSATLLTLLIIPVEYELSEKLRLRLRKLTRRPEEGGYKEEE